MVLPRHLIRRTVNYEYDYRESHEKNVKKRLAIFMEMDEHALFNDLVLTVDNESKLVELMDTLVMKIDGASEQEIQVMIDLIDRYRPPLIAK